MIAISSGQLVAQPKVKGQLHVHLFDGDSITDFWQKRGLAVSAADKMRKVMPLKNDNYWNSND